MEKVQKVWQPAKKPRCFFGVRGATLGIPKSIKNNGSLSTHLAELCIRFYMQSSRQYCVFVLQVGHLHIIQHTLLLMYIPYHSVPPCLESIRALVQIIFHLARLTCYSCEVQFLNPCNSNLIMHPSPPHYLARYNFSVRVIYLPSVKLYSKAGFSFPNKKMGVFQSMKDVSLPKFEWVQEKKKVETTA